MASSTPVIVSGSRLAHQLATDHFIEPRRAEQRHLRGGGERTGELDADSSDCLALFLRAKDLHDADGPSWDFASHQGRPLNFGRANHILVAQRAAASLPLQAMSRERCRGWAPANHWASRIAVSAGSGDPEHKRGGARWR
jgi:hypothetical protein